MAVLIAAAVTVSITNESDLFDNDSEASRHADDGESFRAVAGWLIFIAICGIAFEIVMAVTRALVNGEFLVVKFTMYGLVVSLNNHIHTYVCDRACKDQPCAHKKLVIFCLYSIIRNLINIYAS